MRHRLEERRRPPCLDVVAALENLQRGGTMPTGSNVLCKCGRLMGPIKNSVTVEELMEDGAPYKLWRADHYGCQECGNEVIVGFGRDPIVEHYEPEYADVRARAGEIFPARCRPPGWPTRGSMPAPPIDARD